MRVRDNEIYLGVLFFDLKDKKIKCRINIDNVAYMIDIRPSKFIKNNRHQYDTDWIDEANECFDRFVEIIEETVKERNKKKK